MKREVHFVLDEAACLGHMEAIDDARVLRHPRPFGSGTPAIIAAAAGRPRLRLAGSNGTPACGSHSSLAAAAPPRNHVSFLQSTEMRCAIDPFWPLMILAFVVYAIEQAWKKATPENKEDAARGIVGFLARKFK